MPNFDSNQAVRVRNNIEIKVKEEMIKSLSSVDRDLNKSMAKFKV